MFWAAVAFSQLLAAAVTAWLCPLPPRMRFSWVGLATTLMWWVPLPGLVASLVWRLCRQPRQGVAWAAWWWGPMVVLGRVAPMWLPLAVMGWMFHLTSLLRRSAPERYRAIGMATSLLLQAVVAMAAVGYAEWAALVVLAPAGLLGWGGGRVRRPASRVVAGVVFLLLALVPFGSFLQGPVDGGGGPRLRMPVSETGDAAKEKAEVHRGVILWPPRVEQAKLVAPVRRVAEPARWSMERPLRFVFNGVYWYFQSPFSAPPPGSVEERGRATEKSYRSNSAPAMQMEAHQHLGTRVALDCCARIEVEVLNNDTRAREVFLELVLWDTDHQAWQSLGVAPTSMAALASGAGVKEVVRFPLVKSRRLTAFDAVTIRYHQPELHRRRSLKLGIEAFTLVPR